jgi:hypothetical protein
MKVFENENGKKYGYDFNKLTVDQAEYAKEVGEFKLNQMENRPDNVDVLLRTRGVEYLSIIASYLLRELDGDGNAKPFKPEDAKQTESYVKSLPVKYQTELNEMVTDFFSNIGLSMSGLALHRGWQKRQEEAMLSSIVAQLMNPESNLNSTQNKMSENEDVMTKESLREDSQIANSESGTSEDSPAEMLQNTNQ